VRKAFILCYGSDMSLLDLRCRILLQAGYKSSACCTCEQVSETLSAGGVWLLLLCHTLAEAEQQRVIRLAQNHKETPEVLILFAGDGIEREARGLSYLGIDGGPRALLERVRLLKLERSEPTDSSVDENLSPRRSHTP
jgi:DNA-binding response OmpR family regulator